jgi:hypothetical protein
MALTPEEQKELDDIEEQERAEARAQFSDKEKASLEKEYIDEYNRSLGEIFTPSAVRNEPNKQEKEEAKESALSRLSSKYSDLARGNERGRMRENLPPLPEGTPSSFKSMIDADDRSFSLTGGRMAGSAEEAEAEFKALSGAGRQRSGTGITGAFNRLLNSPETRIPGGVGPTTPGNLRMNQLAQLQDNVRKYQPENIRNTLFPQPAQPAEEVQSEVGPEAVQPADAEPSKKESTEPPAAVVKTVMKGDETLTELDKYRERISLTTGEKKEFAEIEGRLKDSLDSAKKAYSQGMRSTELYKALEKIGEGLALYGAGLYGKKSGIDAVSGLKFSPIDWSTRTDRLTKELDMADKSYTKGMETVKEEKSGMEKLKEQAVKFEEGRKERDEKRAERLSTKEVATQEKGVKDQKDILERQIKALDRQIEDIKDVRAKAPKSGNAAENLYTSQLDTLKVPKEEYMTGMFGGFRENSADIALAKKQQELIAARDRLEKQLTGEAVVSQSSAGRARTAEEEKEFMMLEAKAAGK